MMHSLAQGVARTYQSLILLTIYVGEGANSPYTHVEVVFDSPMSGFKQGCG